MSITAALFLICFGTGLILAFVRHPIYGLYAYFLAFYVNPTSSWWEYQVPNVRWSLVAAVVTLIATVTMPRNSRFPPWFSTWPARLLTVYVSWMWVQMLWAISPPDHLEMSILFTKYVILFYLIYTICSDVEKITAFSLAHVAGCFYLGWLAFGTNVSGRLETIGGAGIGDANTLGMHLTTGLAFAGFLLLGLPDWRRWAVFLAIPFILNGIILTGSRGAFVGLLAAGVAAWYLKPQAYRKWFYLAAALALVLFVRLAHDLFWERTGSTVAAFTDEQTELDRSAASRLSIISSQWKMARAHPLGTGGRGTRILSPFYLEPQYLSETGVRASHNTVMSTLVDQGFLGLFLYLLGVTWVAVTLHRLRFLDYRALPVELGMYRAAVGSALAASFVSGQFSNFLKAEVQIWCVAILAVLCVLAQNAVSPISSTAGPARHPAESPRNRRALKSATTRNCDK